MKNSNSMQRSRKINMTQAKELLQEKGATVYKIARKRVHKQLKELEPEIAKAKTFMKKNPVASVVGAAVVGFVVGKLFGRKKTTPPDNGTT